MPGVRAGTRCASVLRFTLVISRNGKAAINFEHSWGDGVAIVRFMNEIHKDALKHSVVLQPSGPAVAPQTRLQWKVTDTVAKGVREAAARFDADSKAMGLQVLTTEVMNKERLKKSQVSPDGFLQMSFQLAYHRLYGKTVSTYESASTAAFKHGRTECIRSASVDSAEFTKTFADASSSVRTRPAGAPVGGIVLGRELN